MEAALDAFRGLTAALGGRIAEADELRWSRCGICREAHHMYPLPAHRLTLKEIAHHWHRQLPGVPPEEEVLDQMWQHFWSGELAGLHRPDAPGTPQPLTRPYLLGILHGFDAEHPHPMVEFVSDPADTGVTRLPDGGATTSWEWSIYLPERQDDWNEELLQAAYQTLAKTEHTDVHQGAVAGFILQHISRADFATYCRDHGYALPAFWFSDKFRFQSSQSAITRCRAWLIEQVRMPKRWAKNAYRSEALQLFPNLTPRAFDRVWSEVVPEEWKKGGRASWRTADK